MKILTACFSMAVLLLSGCQTRKDSVINLEDKPAKAEVFAKGVVSTQLYERDIAISPNGDEIVFTLGDYRQTKRWLVSVSRKGKSWSEKKIMSFSGRHADIEPFFSADGNELFFASNRPVNGDSDRTDYNIWSAKRNTTGWDEPTPLPAYINTEKDEFYPAVAGNGNLYFTAQRSDGKGGEDIFVSRYINGQYGIPELLDSAINTAGDEFNAYINPGENLIIFGTYGRSDGFGGVDLYYSRKDENGNWTPSRNLGEAVNSGRLDFCPFIDEKRGNFYFTSDRVPASFGEAGTISELENFSHSILNGMGNIYKISIGSLDLQ